MSLKSNNRVEYCTLVIEESYSIDINHRIK